MSDDFPTLQAGRLADGLHLLPLRVYYEDTDFSGVVYHANYLRFLERGRTEFIRALGIDQRVLHAKQGIGFVVRSMSMDFSRPAFMDDIVLVETKAGKIRGSSLLLTQRIRRGADLIASAEVLIVCVRAGRPLRVPEELRRLLAIKPHPQART
jgi:acyl-CoA thioester hydrolase